MFRLIQQISEFFPCFPQNIRIRRVCDRVVVLPVEGFAGVDDGAAVGDVAVGFLFRRQPWIGGGRPGAFDNIDGGRRVTSGAHGPNQLF